MSEDLNLSVLCGRLATSPDIVINDSGSRQMRLLVTVNARHPRRRVDVVPVTLYDPPDCLVDEPPCANSRVWVTGAVQRRGFDGIDGRRSRIEVIADQVVVLGEHQVRTEQLAR